MTATLLIAIGLVIAAFAMMALRIIFVRGGEFRGTCAANSPYLNKEGIACGVCGRMPGEACGKDDDKKVTLESRP